MTSRVPESAEVLRAHGVQPSAQRVAVADYVLRTGEHPSADQVLARVREQFPMISRATVYNTLHLLVRRGLLRQLVLTEGRVVFDPKTERHHHFIDEATGEIHDIPWGELSVRGVGGLGAQFQVDEYQVVLRGRRLPWGHSLEIANASKTKENKT